MNKFVKLASIFLLFNSSIFSADQNTNTIENAQWNEKQAKECLDTDKILKCQNTTCQCQLIGAVKHFLAACEIYYRNYMDSGETKYLEKAKSNFAEMKNHYESCKDNVDREYKERFESLTTLLK